MIGETGFLSFSCISICIVASIILLVKSLIGPNAVVSGRIPGPPELLGVQRLITYFNCLRLGIPGAASYYGRRYGDFVRIWIANEPTFIITRPSAVWHILKTNGNNYVQRFGNRNGLQEIGMHENGIIWNKNVDNWRYLRGFFQKALNAQTLQRAVSVSVAAASRQLTKLPADGEVDGLMLVRRMTLDVVNTLMLKVEIDDENDIIDRIVKYFKAWEYFLIRPPCLYYFSPFEFNQHQQAVKKLKESISKLVEIKERSVTLKNETCNLSETESLEEIDFTTALIEAKMQGKVSEEDLNQSVLEMLLAGTDTSSVTTYYMLVEVANKPNVAEKLLEEIKDVIGERELTKSDLPKLVYMESVIKESMRFKPVGPVILRRALEDDVVDGIQFPKGTNVILNIADMHRLDSSFNSASEFEPDNFENKEMNGQNYVPFGTGPRGCVGQFLAMVEMKAILVTILREYRLQNSDQQSLKTMATHWDIAQQPTEGQSCQMVFRKI